jgi:alpha-beta hydrolase superfamily lysophospholipase
MDKLVYPCKTGFVSVKNLKIFYRKYQADSERARLVISHGLGEHSGRYGNIVEKVLPNGISIWALDHRGHGRSDGPRGHVSDFGNYIEDLRTIVQMSRADLPEGMKCFLLGHSMGGLIALNFALGHPDMINGVITSSPSLGLRVNVPVIKGALGMIMSTICPRLTLGNELDTSMISHDAEVVSAYHSDPLVHTRISVRWFTEFLSAMSAVNRLAPKMEVPILMQVAGDDYLVNANASKTFFEKLILKDKTLHIYDGLYHEIYNEEEKQRFKVLADLQNWLENHI